MNCLRLATSPILIADSLIGRAALKPTNGMEIHSESTSIPCVAPWPFIDNRAHEDPALMRNQWCEPTQEPSHLRFRYAATNPPIP